MVMISSRDILNTYLPFLSLGVLCLLSGCSDVNEGQEIYPNVVLIMADDMGFECLQSNGARDYKTPILDEIGREGVRFNQTYSQPLCTPSRVKIMTGLYNYRNYEYFGYLNENQKTFGSLMKEAGYATAIVGKWQLNGLAYDLPGYQDSMRPMKFGFDEHCLWQLTDARKEGERFANPLIRQNGALLPRDSNAYGPDIFCSYALDFISRKKDQPFFLYYPMVLVHEPFVPTPDSDAWSDPSRRYERDTAYYSDMMTYTDKIVGKIVKHLDGLGLDNTLLIFTADNGTHTTVRTFTNGRVVQGAKGNTIMDGHRVPMVAQWPKKVTQAIEYNGLVNFNDFFATFADIIKLDVNTDGISFLPVLEGNTHPLRKANLIHYDPKWGKNVNRYKNQYAHTHKYKLYRDGRFYNLEKDVLEQAPMSDLSTDEQSARMTLQSVIDMAPEWTLSKEMED